MSGKAELEPLDLPEHRRYTHRAHRFPGKFHPPLIKKLLQDHPAHDVIADPMCGSGTVGVEGVAAGKEVLCVDLDPLSCLITRGKTRPVAPDDLRAVGKRVLDRAGKMPSEGAFDEDAARAEVEQNLDGTPFVPPYNLFHWFEPYVAVGYARLLNAADAVLEIEPPTMEDAILTALAAIVRRNSRADPQPVSGLEVTSVRKEQLDEGIDFDVAGSFQQAMERLAEGYRQLLEVDTLGTTTVVEGNANRFSTITAEQDHQPTMVITSPPYCNAIEYTRRHRLECEWLGLFDGDSLNDVRQTRIQTSRSFFGSRTVKQDTLEEYSDVPHDGVQEVTDTIAGEEGEERKANLLRKYFHDAYDWMEEIYIALPDDGLFCMTIGPSTSYGHTIDTPQYLSDIATDTGFTIESERRYKLTNNKMQYPTNGETTEFESLLKFRK